MQEILYTIQKIQILIEPTSIKVVLSAGLGVLFFFFGDLYTQALLAILMLMVIDTVFAILAAYHNGEEITSRKFSRALYKSTVYFTAISAGYFADITVPFNFIQGTMVAFVGVTEFISVLENMGKMGYKTPRKLLNNLRDYRNNQ